MLEWQIGAGQDDALKDYAKETIPTVLGHLEEAQSSDRELKFARDVETKQKGLTINTLSDSDIAKVKELAKKQIDDEVARLEKEGKPAKEFMAEFLK